LILAISACNVKEKLVNLLMLYKTNAGLDIKNSNTRTPGNGKHHGRSRVWGGGGVGVGNGRGNQQN
jgi:hypothetical protein